MRNSDSSTFDIHDRVNYSVESSRIMIDKDSGKISLVLHIDTSISAVMDYFRIFMERMQMCKHAAEALGLTFSLVINEQVLL